MRPSRSGQTATRPWVEGTALPYGAEADIAGLFTERVDPGAFKGGMGDVILNLQHRRDAPIARTDGGGLVLTDSADRLFARAEIAAYRGDVIDMVKRAHLEGLFRRNGSHRRGLAVT